jgi:hypothetical protein
MCLLCILIRFTPPSLSLIPLPLLRIISTGFFIENTQTQNKSTKFTLLHPFLKSSPPSLAIKEMQIKTTLRFHLTPVRIANIKTPPPTGVSEDVGKKELSDTVGKNVS